MAQSLRTELPALELLLGAERTGTLSLVDEQGQPLALIAALDRRCWAHLTDAQNGRVYVHELPAGRELVNPQYIEMLGLNI